MITYDKPTFNESDVLKFEQFIDTQIKKGNMQITISTGLIGPETQKFASYLSFYYPSGSFNHNPNFRNYRIAKNGKKYVKKENW